MPDSPSPRRVPALLAGALLAAAGSALADRAPSTAHAPQLAPAQPATLVGTCESLAGRLATLAQTTITLAATVPTGGVMLAGQPVPEHCRVVGRMNARTSPVDGRPYAIGFEVRLPKNWNGRFWHQGNGGIDGNVAAAFGTLLGGPRTGALFQGFAVLSSDAGHPGSYGPTFGADPQARLDYGYQAVGTLTPMAKQLIAVAYGKGPDRSYFGGCSNGGRHALIAADRYADEYDGILAGAPGYRLPLAALANIWGGKRYASVATGDPSTPPGLETAFTTAERRTVAAAVVARCDALDGLADGIVSDSPQCQKRFDLFRDVPTCAGARDGSCLTPAQKIAIDPIFKGGATLANGERFYAGFPYDAGIGAGGIPFWEFTAPLVLDSGAVGLIFKVPPEPVAGFNGPAFALNADIDALYAQLFTSDGTYTESAMSFMTPPGDGDLSTLRRRGGKVIVYHGVSDPIFSVDDSERWYREVQRRSGGAAHDVARLYPVPGMGHCSGGPATDQADLITPLVEWVEQGKAPQAIVASARGPGTIGGPPNGDVPASWSPSRTRPLCPFPSIAVYRGGDPEVASSFVCRAAPRGNEGRDAD